MGDAGVAAAERSCRLPCVEIYLEVGTSRVFAGAIEWPGWCRAARREDAAVEALLAAAPRYARAMRGTRPPFARPRSAGDVQIVERLRGDSTTDFGAPAIAPNADGRAVDARELARLRSVLERCWKALDRAAEAAEGRELRKGPRGGGKDLLAILGHVVGAEAGYLTHLAHRHASVEGRDPREAAVEVRAAVRETLSRAVTEGLPETGPRGGKIWTPRFFVRRDAWHVLDHAWEIEDRADPDERAGPPRGASRGR